MSVRNGPTAKTHVPPGDRLPAQPPLDAELSLNRRRLVVGGSLAAAAGFVGFSLGRRVLRERAAVFVARHQRYDGSLVRSIRDGLIATGLQLDQLRGKRVLLKPNLVEPQHTAPHVTTHPSVIAAAAELFLSLGAHVAVGEGPGHMRDTELILSEGNLQETLDDLRLSFADLNYEEVGWRANRGQACPLDGFYFPQSVLDADLIVSMPKMKTHHWAGATVSLKNMFGVMPGIKYGWPKNVLHHAGIPQCVFDINATLPKTVAIVDGIDCMEGDGPIMGTPKHMGLIVVGTNLTAVDATVCRLMQIDPTKVEYLALAADRLGPLDDYLITQRGEPWRPLASRFELLDERHLRHLRPRVI